MNSESYFSLLEKRFNRYFDVKKNINIHDQNIDMYSRFSLVSNQTFITKQDVIDSYINNEHCYIKYYDQVESYDASKFIEFLLCMIGDNVKPGRNHMSTHITGVIVSNNQIPLEVENYIKAFRYSKVYWLYLHGWSELRLVAVDLVQKKVITNKAGRAVKKVYEITP